MNTWQKYVSAVTGDVTQTAIEAQTGIAQSTISRWLNGTKVPTEAAQVAKFAQAYKRNPLEAFVAAEMLTEREAGRGLSDEERAYLRAVKKAGTLVPIRHSQVSNATQVENAFTEASSAGMVKKAARTRDQPPSDK